MNMSHLDWPFFVPAHKALAADFHEWTAKHLTDFESNEGGDGKAARRIFEGPMAALDDRPRPGKEPVITIEAKAWLTSLACRKAKELGYPHELWTTRLLARHAREHGPAEGHACLASLAQGTVARSSIRRRSSRTRCATTWSSAIPSFLKRWPKCCASIAG